MRSLTSEIKFRQVVPLLTVALGLTLSVSAFVAMRRSLANHRQNEFEKDFLNCSGQVQAFFDGPLREVEDIRNFFENSDFVSRDEFRSFTAPMIQNHREIRAVCWVPRVAAGEKAAFVLKARSEGLEGFQFHGGRIGERSEQPTGSFCLPVFYCEPVVGNEAIFGLDLSREPTWRSLLEAVADKGRIAAREGPAPFGVDSACQLLVSPVYHKDSSQLTAQGRRENLPGFIIGVVDISQGLAVRLADRYDHLAVRLTAVSSGSEANRLLYSNGRGAGSADWPRQTGMIRLADRQYRLEVGLAEDYFAAYNRYVPAMILVGGVTLTGLAALYLFNLLNQHRRTEGLVAERTRQFHQEKENARQWAQKAEEASQAKSLFLANMSHEVRTPMNAIIGFAEILAEENLDDAQHDYVMTIYDSAQTLLSLINDILDISKIEAGKLEIEWLDCELPALLGRIEMLLGPSAARKGLDLAVHVCEGLPDRIETDPGRLRQCLINLVSNAIKFTETGHVYINVSLEVEGRADRIRFDVEDTGVGIPPERQDAIFDAFTQSDRATSRQYGGTGLGLTITRKLSRLLGGDLTLHSAVGRGSVFTMTVPSRRTAPVSVPL